MYTYPKIHGTLNGMKSMPSNLVRRLSLKTYYGTGSTAFGKASFAYGLVKLPLYTSERVRYTFLVRSRS